MNTSLSLETEQTILNLGNNAFDWYSYAQKKWSGQEDIHTRMDQKLKHFKETARLSPIAEVNFAINSYLHRNFHHWGYLPEANTDYWYDMLFLYLHLYRLPVPTTHRHSSYSDWVNRPKGAAETAAAEIRQVLRRS